MLVTEGAAPVGELSLHFAGSQPLTLPDGKIHVVQFNRRQRRGLVLRESVIEGDKLTQQDGEGPVVGDDMVQSHQQVMLLGRHLHQRYPQQWPLDQVERRVGFALQHLLQPGMALLGAQLAQVDPLQRQRHARVLQLPAVPAFLQVSGAQHRMALNQPLERLFDSADIEHAVEPEGARNVVHRAFRRQLPKEPEPLLGIG
ncbi:hypothetical protein D3C79_714070 [compost metagenome]